MFGTSWNEDFSFTHCLCLPLFPSIQLPLNISSLWAKWSKPTVWISVGIENRTGGFLVYWSLEKLLCTSAPLSWTLQPAASSCWIINTRVCCAMRWRQGSHLLGALMRCSPSFSWLFTALSCGSERLSCHGRSFFYVQTIVLKLFGFSFFLFIDTHAARDLNYMVLSWTR